ncbi:uncharacterized protein [Haliotis cracherodii]|uniref:uncharacterized protein n=1 Tax=Haliotis cracherodii TaxID=6455 RepID=UPI0039E7B4CE
MISQKGALAKVVRHPVMASLSAMAFRAIGRGKAWCGHMSRMMYCTKEQSSANIPNQPTPTKTEDAVDPAPDISSYKVKEYYSHNDFSFYDIDADMKTHRLKQPSSHGALQP